MPLDPTQVSDTPTIKDPTSASLVTAAQYLIAIGGGVLVGKGVMKASDLSQLVSQIPTDVAAIVAMVAAAKGVWSTVRGIYKQYKIATKDASQVQVKLGGTITTAADPKVQALVAPSPSKSQ